MGGSSKVTPPEACSLVKLSKNNIPSHVLGNNDLPLLSYAQYVLLLLALAVNSNWFLISQN